MFVRKFPRQAIFCMLTAALFLASCGGTAATQEPTVDPNAISTAAAETVMAQLSLQFTQTAQAAPSPTTANTNTPVTFPTSSLPTLGAVSSPTTGAGTGALPTVSFLSTPLPGVTQLGSTVVAPPAAATAPLGDACNNSIYIADLTIPDGTVLRPGEDFRKVWQFRNTGSCTWDEGYGLIFIGGDQAIDPVNYEITASRDFIGPGEDAEFDIPLTAPLTEGTYQGTWRMRNDQGVFFGTLLTVVFEVKKP